MTPIASILIPSTRTSRTLEECLRSLEEHRPGLPFETIVVCHGGHELRAEGVTFLDTVYNHGLAGAANLARAHARGEFLVLLHDDSRVESGWLEALVEAARRDPQAGAVGSRVFNPDGSLQAAGLIQQGDGSSRSPWCTGADPPAFDQSRVVDMCTSSSLLVRASSWDRLGGLDEQFYPAYWVDADLCMGIWSLGQHVRYEPGSQAVHRRWSSTTSPYRDFLVARNRKRFRAKWSTALAGLEYAVADTPEAIAQVQARPRQPILPDVPAHSHVAEDTATREQRYAWEQQALQRDYAHFMEQQLELWRQTAETMLAGISAPLDHARASAVLARARSGDWTGEVNQFLWAQRGPFWVFFRAGVALFHNLRWRLRQRWRAQQLGHGERHAG